MQLKETNRIFQEIRGKDNKTQNVVHNTTISDIVSHKTETESEYSDPEFEEYSEEEDDFSEEQTLDNTFLIISQARKDEVNIRTSCNLFEKTQTEVSTNNRESVVKWLIKLHYYFNLTNEVLFNSITYLDILMCTKNIPKAKLQLYASVCYWVSAKVDTRAQPSIEKFNELTGEKFTIDLFASVEIELITALNFKLSYPTAKLFIRQPLNKYEANENIRNISRFISEISLFKFEFLDYRPSMIAASALILSFASMGQIETAKEILKQELEFGSNINILKKCLHILKKHVAIEVESHLMTSTIQVKELLQMMNLNFDIEAFFQSR